MYGEKKHTIESVKADLQKELENLSTTEWSECGDNNMREFGGVRYRKTEQGSIELEFYRGLEYIPEEIPDFLETVISLDEILDCIEDIWIFSDVENCGLDIGWGICSVQAYNGFLNGIGGWKFSEET